MAQSTALQKVVFMVLMCAIAFSVDSDNAFVDTDRIVPELMFDELQMEVSPIQIRWDPTTRGLLLTGC